MKILIPISGICLVLLFVGGPDYYSPRSYQYAWNLGHIFFFSIFTYLLVSLWQRISKERFLKQCVWVLSVALFFGILIELGQAGLNDRTPDIYDLIGDITGVLVGLVFFVPSRRLFPKIGLHVFQVIVLIIILLSIFPLGEALIDEAIARQRFPVLSDLETPFEIKRWVGHSKFEIDHKIFRQGKSSLKVFLNTDQYSGVGLKYFANNWGNYNYLQFSLFNPSSDPIKIGCRIHDIHHIKHGQDYNDRFNTSYLIPQGWRDIRISIKDIVNAPKNRKMDLRFMQGFYIFVVRLPQPKLIYIDSVRLEK
jgi:VanZ family protein